jgi:hypothetical protein
MFANRGLFPSPGMMIHVDPYCNIPRWLINHHVFLYSINIHNIQYSSGFQSLRSAMPQLTEELIRKRSLVFLAEFRAVAMARKDVCSSEKRLNQWDLCGQIELKVEAMITFHYPELVLF